MKRELTPEQCAIEYDRTVRHARWRLTYRLNGVKVNALAIDARHLHEVLRDLRLMGITMVAVHRRH